jgi:hypothetical protein
MKKGTPLKLQGALKTSDEKEGTPNKCNPIKTPSMKKESPCKKKKNCTIVEPKIKRNHQVTERIASTNQMVQGEGDASWFVGYREKI